MNTSAAVRMFCGALVAIPMSLGVYAAPPVTGTFVGDGSGLTNLNATALGSGTVPVSRLAGKYNQNVKFNNPTNIFYGTFIGNAVFPGVGGPNWTTSVFTGIAPDSSLVTNALAFSAGSVMQFGIAPNKGARFFLHLEAAEFSSDGDISAEGSINASGGISAGGPICGQACLPSDRNLKEQFAPIDGRDVLERVVGLPISRWSFKKNAATRHIGPMAQDFHAAFQVGTDDKHIDVVDQGGVALAAIQGLYQVVKEKDARITELEKRLADLETKLQKVSRHLEVSATTDKPQAFLASSGSQVP